MDLIETWRREKKWAARQIHIELTGRGHQVSIATIGRWFVRPGINRRKDLDPTGESNKRPGKIIARFAGYVVHLDAEGGRTYP